MAYIIGIILFIIALIIFGLILRKRIYDDVDRLEGWKLDIMNRNVSSELARVKALVLSGETQEKFESWKGRWDFIVTRELPDLEEFLFDAEEAADRFRILSAKKHLQSVNDTLVAIEKDIEQMFEELDHLIDTEQHSREEMAEVKPLISRLRNKLIQNSYQYGKAEIRFDVEIDELAEKVVQYEELVNAGNYFEAQSVVGILQEEIQLLEEQIDVFPAMYKKCKNELPAEIDSLISGMKDMKEEGYHIEYLGFEKELLAHQERLVSSATQLEKGSLSDATEIILPIEERIAEIYHLLEKEALAKSFLDQHLPSYRKKLAEVTNSFKDTKQEVEKLQETYFFEDSDLELHLHMDKWIAQLNKLVEELQANIGEENHPYIESRESFEQAITELEEVQANHEEFKQKLRDLRKDELDAKEKVLELRKSLFETNRKLEKSNIPGIPAFIWKLMDDATENCSQVVLKLDKQPLDMGEVHHVLQEAEKSVLTLIDQTEALLDQAGLVEFVIQYANRYRSQYAILSAKLYEAENMFRQYDYENALQQAVQALEEVEPGAIDRIDQYRKIPS
ncbi:septation ring formation regulator EzrA [Radiobacillus sp. PE A8.2]|uniref:septation ring formation regulator EzrA n=1 Tax=Radiobacillus sp. PE A8.2 TaxID=3380349 RepID=UPI0038908DA1